jgi:hypothetical protein
MTLLSSASFHFRFFFFFLTFANSIIFSPFFCFASLRFGINRNSFSLSQLRNKRPNYDDDDDDSGGRIQADFSVAVSLYTEQPS